MTAAAYQVIPEGIDAIGKNSFKKEYSEMIEKVNKLEDKIQELGLQISTVQWYELVASIAYWHKKGYHTRETILEKLQETKPQFSKEQVDEAYQVYGEFKRSC